ISTPLSPTRKPLPPYSFILVCLACSIAAAPTHAQTAILFRVGGHAHLAEFQGRVTNALTHELESQRVRVLSQAHPGVAPTDRRCHSIECAPTMLRTAAADFAIVVSLWGEGAKSPTVVTLALVEPDGTRFPSTAQVGDEGVETAALTALAEAQSRRALGR